MQVVPLLLPVVLSVAVLFVSAGSASVYLDWFPWPWYRLVQSGTTMGQPRTGQWTVDRYNISLTRGGETHHKDRLYIDTSLWRVLLCADSNCVQSAVAVAVCREREALLGTDHWLVLSTACDCLDRLVGLMGGSRQ